MRIQGVWRTPRRPLDTNLASFFAIPNQHFLSMQQLSVFQEHVGNGESIAVLNERPAGWPAPENPETINRKQLGDLKLTDKQESLLVFSSVSQDFHRRLLAVGKEADAEKDVSGQIMRGR